MDQRTAELLRVMLRVEEVPADLIELHDEAVEFSGPVDGSPMSAHELALLIVMADRLPGVMSHAMFTFWDRVTPGTEVMVDWHGTREGKFVRPLDKQRLLIQLPGGVRAIRAKRVRLLETPDG